MSEKMNNTTTTASTGYTAFELWKATRDALIRKSFRYATGKTIVPSVAICFTAHPHARFEEVRVGTLNRRKGGKALVNNVVIGRLIVDTTSTDLVRAAVQAIAWYMVAQQDGHMSRTMIYDVCESVLRKLDAKRLAATTAETMSDLADPRAVSKAYNAFFRI